MTGIGYRFSHIWQRVRTSSRGVRGALGNALMVAVVVSMLGACASDEDTYVEQPVEDLYNIAMNRLLAGDFEQAAVDFDEVERQHPYSVWATKAQVMSAFAHYRADEYDDAVLAADRFLDLHPGHRDAPYALYLKGVSYYERISDVRRDQKMTRLALETFETLVKRFPETEYARDARLKIDLTLDHLAGKEMDVGRFYQRWGNYIGAINRFRAVIENYQTTTHVPEALHRVTESFLALGVVDEARDTAAVLGYNYPGSEWYIDSYALLTGIDVREDEGYDDPRSWLGRTWDAIF
jgi:outer membrane protein assembly factor BamD